MRGFHPVPSAPFDQDAACDLDTLLHPSQAFESPAEVLNDPDLSLNEKRAILASWASDACAVEVVPSPKFHHQAVGELVEASVNCTVRGAAPLVGAPENAATGAGTITLM